MASGTTLRVDCQAPRGLECVLVLDKRDQYLFVFAERGIRTLLFDLRDDPARPRFVGSLRVQSAPSAPPHLPVG